MQYIILATIWFSFGYFTKHFITKRKERAFRDELYSKILEKIAETAIANNAIINEEEVK